MYFQKQKAKKLETCQNKTLSRSIFANAIETQSRIMNKTNNSFSVSKENKTDYSHLKKRDIYTNWKILHNLYTGVILLVVFVALYHFYHDANNRIQSEIRQKRISFEVCRTEYHENDCISPKPALRKFCLEKEHCLLSDAEKEITKIGSVIGMLVEISNTAVEKTNLKTLITLSVLFIGYGIVTVLRTLFGR